MAGAAAVPLAPAARPAVSLYEALRVGRAATQGEIRAAYRGMAKRLHPDSRGGRAPDHGGPEAFLEMRRAYETLADPTSRARYDRSLGVGAASRSRVVGGGVGGMVVTRRWETDQCW